MFRSSGWKDANKRMLAAVDQEVYLGFIQEQVDLLGGCKTFYQEVANSLTRGINTFIKEEQKTLYNWRSKFFREKFKCIYFGDPNPSAGEHVESTFYWYTDGRDDAHCSYTKPYQITERFDELMKLAASTVKLRLSEERIHFECYEGHPGRKIEYSEDESDYDEWEDEDYDHCQLIEDGKLEEWSCDCQVCAVRKEKYIKYLLGSENIKNKYWKWKQEEENKDDEEEANIEDFSDVYFK